MRASLASEFEVFSSGINARRGGIAIILKKSFLAKFEKVAWKVECVGRVAQLRLEGNRGKVCILPVYLDPSSVEEQIKQIQAIETCIDDSALNIVAGDFNFVVQCGDRITISSGNVCAEGDKRQTYDWERMSKKRKLLEFEQSSYTCENSHGWSRIDRVYTSMHQADMLSRKTFCATVDHPRHLSDHSPVCFGVQRPARGGARQVPSWIATHPDFEEEVKSAMDFACRRYADEHSNGPTAMARLNMLRRNPRDRDVHQEQRKGQGSDDHCTQTGEHTELHQGN